MSTSDKQQWLQMWRDGNTKFHQTLVDSLLERFWGKCSDKLPKTVFIPMCGKSVDIVWLAQRGLKVVAVEISPVAVKAFFKEQGLTPNRKREGHFTIWESGNIKIYCGDYFLLKSSDLGHIDIIYDRAALTALSESVRVTYIKHMHQIMPRISEVFLLTAEEYTNQQTTAVEIEPEISRLYAGIFDVSLVHAELETVVTDETDPPAFLKLYNIQLKSK